MKITIEASYAITKVTVKCHEAIKQRPLLRTDILQRFFTKNYGISAPDTKCLGANNKRSLK